MVYIDCIDRKGFDPRSVDYKMRGLDYKLLWDIVKNAVKNHLLPCVMMARGWGVMEMVRDGVNGVPRYKRF
jgi:hypothetical protein